MSSIFQCYLLPDMIYEIINNSPHKILMWQIECRTKFIVVLPFLRSLQSMLVFYRFGTGASLLGNIRTNSLISAARTKKMFGYFSINLRSFVNF